MHNKTCLNNFTYFPLLGGYGGAAHLYKDYHSKDPWNWTGWILEHQYLPYDAAGSGNKGVAHVLYTNRFFLGLHGNEIQNDMWDYNPNDVFTDEEVKGPYLGGYWYSDDKENREYSRYLHVISLKARNDDDKQGRNQPPAN